MSNSNQINKRKTNPPTASDHVLGVFKHVEPNEGLDHTIRYLGTWSGTDKFLMMIQYSSKLISFILSIQHRLRLRFLGGGATAYHAPLGGSNAAKRVQKLGATVSDARTLYRIWGVLPILKWMISIERVPPPTRLLHQIERIQGFLMLFYCPSEALAYLASKGVLPISEAIQGFLWLWGARAWAVYVMLQLLHLVEDNRILRLRARALERSRGHPSPLPNSNNGTFSEKENLRNRIKDGSINEKDNKGQVGLEDEEKANTRRMWDELDVRKKAILNELWVNLGYLPLTIHWSHPTGLISEAWVGLFGTIAASAGFRSGWRNTALPPVRS